MIADFGVPGDGIHRWTTQEPSLDFKIWSTGTGRLGDAQSETQVNLRTIATIIKNQAFEHCWGLFQPRQCLVGTSIQRQIGLLENQKPWFMAKNLSFLDEKSLKFSRNFPDFQSQFWKITEWFKRDIYHELRKKLFHLSSLISGSASSY